MNFLIFLSTYILPFFIFYVIAYGLWKGRNVYQVFAEGAKGGFSTAIGILPTLVGLLAAVGVLRASGFLDFLSGLLKSLLKGTGFPVELLPLAVVRLFSNSAATGLALDLFKTYGPDSPAGASGFSFSEQYRNRLLYHEHLLYEHKDKKNPLYTAGCSSGNPGRDGGKYVSGASSVNPFMSAVRKRRFPGFTGGHRGWYSEY